MAEYEDDGPRVDGRELFLPDARGSDDLLDDEARSRITQARLEYDDRPERVGPYTE